MCFSATPIGTPPAQTSFSLNGTPVEFTSQYVDIGYLHRHHKPEKHLTEWGGQIFLKEYNSETGRTKTLEKIGAFDFYPTSVKMSCTLPERSQEENPYEAILLRQF